jgi:adenine-specific DNA glycosylase
VAQILAVEAHTGPVFCFHQPHPALARITAAATKMPPAYRVNAHHWLILHGRYVCKARSPDCARCAVSTWCDHHAAGRSR